MTGELKPGDHLVAVDGMHPVAWARTLVDVDWGWWQADDDSVNAEFAERMRSLITAYATTFTVISCDAGTATCSDQPRVIRVRDLPVDEAGTDLVRCDNRPGYHLVDGPDPLMHNVGWKVWSGWITDSQPGENIFGVTWDSLWGPSFTPLFKSLGAKVKAEARGLILDHRAGNGGTIDAPEAVTQLVRDKFDLAIFPYMRPTAGFEGPATAEEGMAIFNRYKKYTLSPDLTYTIGSATADMQLPVALLIHRDGSASDYLPWGMKGAPKVRIFGPHATAGAFSSFHELYFWNNFSITMASGDTISHDGSAQIGHGVLPDEIVLPLQTDLMQGKDTIYERGLAWVRAELKP